MKKLEIYIENMIDIRKEKGYTQEELSKKIGWSRPQIARYESGTSTPNVEYLIAFCDCMKISADWILNIPNNYERRRIK